MKVTNVQNSFSLGNSTSIAIFAGETVALAVTVSINGTPINLTGYSLKMQIDFATPLLLNTDNGGITVVNAAQGQIQINIPSATSATFPGGGYSYDLWMVSGGGAETPLLSGQFEVAPSIATVP